MEKLAAKKVELFRRKFFHILCWVEILDLSRQFVFAFRCVKSGDGGDSVFPDAYLFPESRRAVAYGRNCADSRYYYSFHVYFIPSRQNASKP